MITQTPALAGGVRNRNLDNLKVDFSPRVSQLSKQCIVTRRCHHNERVSTAFG